MSLWLALVASSVQGAADHFSVTAGSPQDVDVAFNVTITARNNDNSIDTAYTGPITLYSDFAGSAFVALSEVNPFGGDGISVWSVKFTVGADGQDITVRDAAVTAIQGIFNVDIRGFTTKLFVADGTGGLNGDLATVLTGETWTPLPVGSGSPLTFPSSIFSGGSSGAGAEIAHNIWLKLDPATARTADMEVVYDFDGDLVYPYAANLVEDGRENFNAFSVPGTGAPVTFSGTSTYGGFPGSLFTNGRIILRIWREASAPTTIMMKTAAAVAGTEDDASWIDVPFSAGNIIRDNGGIVPQNALSGASGVTFVYTFENTSGQDSTQAVITLPASNKFAPVVPGSPVSVMAVDGSVPSAVISIVQPSGSVDGAITVDFAGGGGPVTAGSTGSVTFRMAVPGVASQTTAMFSSKTKKGGVSYDTGGTGNQGVTIVPPASAPASLVGSATNTATGGTSAFLDWNTNPAGEAVIDYVVYQGGSPAVTVTSSNATVNGLTNGSSYNFTVRARNAVGSSVDSGSVGVIPYADHSAPGSPQALANGNGSVSLSWSGSSGGTYPLDHYNVVRSAPGAPVTFSTFSSTYVDNTATNGVSNNYRIHAVDNQSHPQGPGSGLVSANPPVNPPTGLTAVPGSATSIDLSWTLSGNNSAPVTTYVIQRDASGSGFVSIAAVADPANVYSDTSVLPGEAVTYRILADNGLISSPSGTAVTMTSPSAPLSLAGVARNLAADLSWTANSGAEAVTLYRVFQRTLPAGTPTPVATVVSLATAPSTVSYTRSPLVNGVTYEFFLQALRGPATSANSVTIQVVPVPPPSSPTGFDAEDRPGEIFLSWNANPGGQSVYEYEVFRALGAGAFSSAQTVASPTISWLDSGLTNSTSYRYYVVARNTAGNSSNSVTVTGIPDVPPTIPPGLVIRDLTGGVTLAWNAGAAGSNGLGGYAVYKKLAAAGTYDAPVTFGAGTLAATIMGLSSGSTYDFHVKAFDNVFSPVTLDGDLAHESLPTNIVQGYPSSRPEAPTTISSALGEDSSARLIWTVPAHTASGRFPFDGFAVYQSPVSAVFDYSNPTTIWTAASGAPTVSGTPATIVMGSLVNGSVYYFTVRTIDTKYMVRYPDVPHDPHESVSTGQVRVFPAVPPLAPTNVGLRDQSGGVSIWWDPAVAQTYAVAGYKVYRRNLAFGGASVAATVQAPAISTTLGAMLNTAEYELQVTAFDDNTLYDASLPAHESVLSAPVTSRPAPPVGSPVSFAAAETSSAVTLTWNRPVSIAQSRPLQGYFIYRSVSGSPPDYTVDVPYTLVADLGSPVTFVDTGLSAGTTYIYTLSAIDTAYLGLWRPETAHEVIAPVTLAAIPATPPATPLNLRVTSSSGVSIALAWDPAVAGTFPVDRYEIHRSIAPSVPFSAFATVGGAGVTFVDFAVTPNGFYYYKVRALDSTLLSGMNHVSAPSPDLNAVAADLPQPPSGVAAIPGSNTLYGMSATEVRLTWNGSSVTGLPINHYDVHRSTNPSDPSPPAVQQTAHQGSGAAHSVQDSGLVPGTVYYYWILSEDGAGRHSLLGPPTAVQPADPPGPPTSVSVVDANAAVTVSWLAPASAGDLAPIVEYRVYRKLEPSGSYTVAATVAFPSTSALVASLSNGQTYSFRVAAAVNQDPALGGVKREGALSSATGASVGRPAVPPGIPGTIRTVVGDGGTFIEWSATAGTYTRAAHRIYRDGALAATVVQPPTGNPSYTDTSVVNGTPYAYEIETYDVVKNSDPAHLSAKSVTISLTPNPGALVPPSGFTAVAGSASVTLNWTLIPGADSYDVFYGTSPNPSATGSILSGFTAVPMTILSLGNGTPYYFQVRQVEASIPGDDSVDISAVPGAPPSAPASILGVPGDARVDLTWSAVVPAGSQLPLVGYNVYQVSGGVTVLLNGAPIAGTTLNNLSVSNGGAYIYFVKAVDSNGTEGPASASTPTLYPDTGPGQVPWVNSAAGTASVSLTWGTAAPGASYPVGSYRVYQRLASGSYGAPVTTITAPTTGVILSSGISNGLEYRFKIAAVDSQGNPGPDSPESSPVWPGLPPGAPSSFGGTAGNAQVALTWQAPATGSYPVDGFLVWRRVGAGPATLLVDLSDEGQTDWVDTIGLVNGTAYTYEIYAYDGKGVAGNHLGAGATVVGLTPLATEVNPPTSLVGVFNGSNFSVTLTWDAPWGNLETVDRFIVYRTGWASPVTFTPGSPVIPAGPVTYVDAAVPDESALIYRVQALTTLNNSSPDSNPVTIQSSRQVLVLEDEAYLSANTFLPLKGEAVTVEFGLADPAAVQVEVTIVIYSISLDKVLEAKVPSVRGGDVYTWVWDGRDSDGELAASGLYMIHVKDSTGNLKVTRKVVLVK